MATTASCPPRARPDGATAVGDEREAPARSQRSQKADGAPHGGVAGCGTPGGRRILAICPGVADPLGRGCPAARAGRGVGGGRASGHQPALRVRRRVPCSHSLRRFGRSKTRSRPLYAPRAGPRDVTAWRQVAPWVVCYMLRAHGFANTIPTTDHTSWWSADARGDMTLCQGLGLGKPPVWRGLEAGGR